MGSAVHDAIGYEGEGFTKFSREQNNAGGIEGGISNGEDVVVRGYLKPISTLRRPLESVDLATREPALAAYERSDVCVVPAVSYTHLALTRSSSWSQPVVPTTMLTPRAAMRSTFSGTAAGMEKSTATSMSVSYTHLTAKWAASSSNSHRNTASQSR